MAFFSFLDDTPLIRTIFARNEVRYGPISDFRQNIMAGPSPLSQGDRELIAAFVSQLNGCEFCTAQHTANAAKLGVDVSSLEDLFTSIDRAAVSDRLKPILRFVKKLTEEPARITQEDADAVFVAGWSETALGDAIAVCAFFNMMNRIVDGHGLGPSQRQAAAELRSSRG